MLFLQSFLIQAAGINAGSLSPVNNDEVDCYVKWMNDEAAPADFGQYNQLVSSKNDLKWIYEPDNHMHRYAIVLLDGDV